MNEGDQINFGIGRKKTFYNKYLKHIKPRKKSRYIRKKPELIMVKSQRVGSIYYIVSKCMNNQKYMCECPSWSMKNMNCEHVVKVKSYLKPMPKSFQFKWTGDKYEKICTDKK